MTEVDLQFKVWPKQSLALLTDAQHIIYGGAAGGGKSHVARIAATDACLQIPGIQVYLFRRHYEDLVKNHLAGPTGFRTLLYPLVQIGLVKIVDTEIRFYNGPNGTLGSQINLCHCQYDKDVFKFQGAEIHFFIPEETTQFTEYQLRFLMSRVRIPDTLKIPPHLKHKYPRILMATNPGGVSHSFIKGNYIDNRIPFQIWEQPEIEGGRRCIFIPAKLQDNPSINPDEYRAGLMVLKRPELIEAMLNGSWEIPIGAFFPEADARKHMISPFKPANHLFKFRTIDWGSGSPASVNWWVMSDGEAIFGNDGEPLPKGAMICYREWYIANPADLTKGLGLSNQQFIEGIKERTPNNEIIYGTISDLKPWQATGGTTTALDFENANMPLTKGDVSKGSRVEKWQQLRSRLIGVDNVPYFYVTRNCPHLWREITEIQTDQTNFEDVDTTGSDHALDSAGHAVFARPFVRTKPPPVQPKLINEINAKQLFANHFKNMKKLNEARR